MILSDFYSDFESDAPPLLPVNDGLSIVENTDGVLGLGFPQYFVIDNFELADLISGFPAFTGSTGCIYTDLDADGVKDMVVPVGSDLTGDGVNDFAYVVDLNLNGIPDACPDTVFYPKGSPDYKRIVDQRFGGSIIIVNPDGTMTIYDTAGNITEEVVDTAQSLWISENNFLDKRFENYSVSEGFLFLLFVLIGVSVIKFLFGRRLY